MARKLEEIYLSIPIELLSGFMEGNNWVLQNMLYYALYAHTLSYTLGDENGKMLSAAKHFRVDLGDVDDVVKMGTSLYLDIDVRTAYAVIQMPTYWDYMKNVKSEFEKICLLAHMAFTSILGTKAYCKTTNNFLLARMDGKRNTISSRDELSPEIRKYANRYQLDKIKNELVDSWHLTYFSSNNRGFYVSRKLNLKELAKEALKNQKKYKEKKRKMDKERAIKEAQKELEIYKTE